MTPDRLAAAEREGMHKYVMFCCNKDISFCTGDASSSFIYSITVITVIEIFLFPEWYMRLYFRCRVFKIHTTISTSSMVLFDEKNVLRRYDSVMDIMREFYDVRLDLYRARKVRIDCICTATLFAELLNKCFVSFSASLPVRHAMKNKHHLHTRFGV